MQNVLPLFLSLATVFSIVGIVAIIAGLHRAPEGHEDEAGFHILQDEEGFQYRLAADTPLAAPLRHPAPAA